MWGIPLPGRTEVQQMSSVNENIIQIKFLAVEEHYISGSPAAISLWSAAPTIMIHHRMPV